MLKFDKDIFDSEKKEQTRHNSEKANHLNIKKIEIKKPNSTQPKEKVTSLKETIPINKLPKQDSITDTLKYLNGLEPKIINEFYDTNTGDIMYELKWSDNKIDTMTPKMVNTKYPQLVERYKHIKPVESYTLDLNDNRDKFWTEETISQISASSLISDSNCIANDILIKNKDVQWAPDSFIEDNEVLMQSIEHDIKTVNIKQKEDDFLLPVFNFEDDHTNILFTNPDVVENEPEKILQLYDYYGEWKFLIKWKNIDAAEYISTQVANLKYPQCVIKFYEEKIIYEKDFKKELNRV